jgi:GT2 family glycosyltransferase
MQSPLVTIVTPSYNQGQFIRGTIESVLSQDYPHIEYIIMDGGSTDETASVVSDYASRLTWISERDRGQSHAINKGFRRAKGEVVSWLNSDDLILPGAVTKAVRSFERDPSIGAVYGEGYLIDKEGRITGRFPHTQPFNLWKLVYLSDYVLQQTVYFRKSVFEEIGYLEEDLHYVMDWDILTRIGKLCRLEYIPEFMGCLREYPEAKSFAGGARRVREIRSVLRRHTGRRFPPGYIVYGLDTYRQIWCERTEAKTPALLRGPSRKLQGLLTLAAGYWIGRTIRESQGWYQDGWATTEVKWMLPTPRESDVVIRGTLPDCPIREQRLSVVMNGRLLAEEKFTTGEFEIRLKVPIEFRYQPLEIGLKASRSFLPARLGGSPDRRRLCYLLREVTLSERDQGAPPVIAPLGAGIAVNPQTQS